MEEFIVSRPSCIPASVERGRRPANERDEEPAESRAEGGAFLTPPAGTRRAGRLTTGTARPRSWRLSGSWSGGGFGWIVVRGARWSRRRGRRRRRGRLVCVMFSSAWKWELRTFEQAVGEASDYWDGRSGISMCSRVGVTVVDDRTYGKRVRRLKYDGSIRLLQRDSSCPA